MEALAKGTINLDEVSSQELEQIAMNAGLVQQPKPTKDENVMIGDVPKAESK